MNKTENYILKLLLKINHSLQKLYRKSQEKNIDKIRILKKCYLSKVDYVTIFVVCNPLFVQDL